MTALHTTQQGVIGYL